MENRAAKFSSHQIADLGVLIVLAGWVIWYALDVWRASEHIVNWILVLPVSLIILVLCAMEYVRVSVKPAAINPDQESVQSVFPVIGLFFMYVVSLKWLGFDVGTFLFVALFLWIHGERRWPWALGYSLCLAVLLSVFFSKMLPYPMPMLVLPSAY